jgi:hypothetical protein
MSVSLVLSFGCAVESRTEFRDIESVCVEAEEPIDDALWSCDEALVLDCNTDAVPDEIYVRPEGGSCEGVELQPVVGPFAPGVHDIVVVDGEGAAVCETTLEIQDALAPVVTTQTIALWPPNHKFHDVALDDCFASVDDCDPDWVAEVVWVSSDEPDDDRGDGNTSGDVEIVAPDAVQLRAERQGGSNGRVYHVGFTVTDGSGNVTEGACDVVVAHDQGKDDAGVDAIDDGEAYRIEA